MSPTWTRWMSARQPSRAIRRASRLGVRRPVHVVVAMKSTSDDSPAGPVERPARCRLAELERALAKAVVELVDRLVGPERRRIDPQIAAVDVAATKNPLRSSSRYPASVRTCDCVKRWGGVAVATAAIFGNGIPPPVAACGSKMWALRAYCEGPAHATVQLRGQEPESPSHRVRRAHRRDRRRRDDRGARVRLVQRRAPRRLQSDRRTPRRQRAGLRGRARHAARRDRDRRRRDGRPQLHDPRGVARRRVPDRQRRDGARRRAHRRARDDRPPARS